MTVRAGWAQTGEYTGGDDRMVLAGLVLPDAGPFAREGVLRGPIDPTYGGRLFAQAGSGWNTTVAPGSAVVTPQVEGGGCFIASVDEAETVVHDAASGTQNRIDRIVLEILDPEYSGSETGAQITIIKGTGTTGSPSLPAIPAGMVSLDLSQALIPAAAGDMTAATYTDLRAFTAASGGVVYCPSSTLVPPNPWPGLVVWRNDLATLQVYVSDALGWRSVGGIPSNAVASTGSNGASTLGTYLTATSLLFTVPAGARFIRAMGWLQGVLRDWRPLVRITGSGSIGTFTPSHRLANGITGDGSTFSFPVGPQWATAPTPGTYTISLQYNQNVAAFSAVTGYLLVDAI